MAVAPLAVLPEARYGIVQPRSVVVVGDIVECALALATHPDWRPGFTEVWDVRFAPAVEIRPADVPTLLDLERRTKAELTGSTTLIVTAKPLLLFSVRFYAHLMKPFGRRVVGAETEAEAAAFLGVPSLPTLT